MASGAPSVLVVAHGHPEESPGGGELHAYETFLALRAGGAKAATFLFPSDHASGMQRYRRRPDELCFPFASEETEYRLFDDARRVSPGLARAIVGTVREHAPDVVHFHHYYRVGLETIELVRCAVPGAIAALTLHDLKAVCPSGYMVRTAAVPTPAPAEALCSHASPKRCQACFPERRPAELTRRTRLLRAALGAMDLVIAPSRFLYDRYVRWGLDASRIVVLDYGRRSTPVAPGALGAPSARLTRFGFFGRGIPEKGLATLLCAVELLGDDGASGASFVIHSDAHAAVPCRAAGTRVELRGPYAAENAQSLMSNVHWVVVPSLWWENSPLVIKEAFQQRRPVICSDVGGMAENVRDGVDGFHFRIGDPEALAAVLCRVTGDGALWRRLVAATRPPMSAEVHARHLLDLYRRVRHEASWAQRA